MKTKISIISLFPDFIKTIEEHSIIKNALNAELLEIEILNIRDFTDNGHADDTVYGGGKGMLLKIEPIVKAIESIKSEESYVILLGPRGNKFKQEKAKSLSTKKHIILIAGHYEGVDSRIKHFIDEEISIGDYILTGGEIASLVLLDSITRLIPGVIKVESHTNETFENDLFEEDQFTKPEVFRKHSVPKVLLSGNHSDISS
ncbi:MAG: tRNA (guanosine(37)-N1)-methyltransferase TrmD [Tenericutes bacterium]|nr:MAG: tRNA (guanosine(37)-N1)-methyltransferase TrmD [Mycoplasmatota bacterium]